MLYSCHFDKTELKIMIFINFQVYHRNEKHFESSYGLGGCHLKIRDICMDFEQCFKVHNLVVVQLKNTKLGQMTNLNMIFYMVVWCQFINWIKFATRPSPLLDFKVANWLILLYFTSIKRSYGQLQCDILTRRQANQLAELP